MLVISPIDDNPHARPQVAIDLGLRGFGYRVSKGIATVEIPDDRAEDARALGYTVIEGSL